MLVSLAFETIQFMAIRNESIGRWIPRRISAEHRIQREQSYILEKIKD